MLELLTQSTWVERIGWVLVHSLWQFVVVATMAFALLSALARRSANARYRVLLAAMLVLIAAPVATWLSPWAAETPRATAALDTAGTPENIPGAQNRDDTRPMATLDTASVGELAATRQAGPICSGPEPSGLISWKWKANQYIQPRLFSVVLLWLGGVLAAALRPVLGWYTVRRLKTAGVLQVDGRIQAMRDRVAGRLGLSRAVDVLQSSLAKTPMVVGCFRPVVLLPLSVVTSLPAGQLELILAHELAHIRRYDYLINLLQTVIETILFYHPAVWWLSRRIRNEREHCCDDAAMASMGRRAEYGRALLAIEELRASATAVSLAARGGSLIRRIRRIAGGEPARRVAGGGCVLCILLISMAMFAGVTWVAASRAEMPDEAKNTLPTADAKTAVRKPIPPCPRGGLSSPNWPRAGVTISTGVPVDRIATATVDPGLQPMGYDRLAFLPIQKELELTSEQTDRLTKIQTVLASEAKQFFEKNNLHDGAQADGAPSPLFDQWKNENTPTFKKQVDEVLTPQQQQAYNDIRLNADAWCSLGYPPSHVEHRQERPVSYTALGLSEAQIKQLDSLKEEHHREMQQRSRNGEDRILAVLTPEQRAKLREVATGPLGIEFTEIKVLSRQIGLSAEQEAKLHELKLKSTNDVTCMSLERKFGKRMLEVLTPDQREKLPSVIDGVMVAAPPAAPSVKKPKAAPPARPVQPIAEASGAIQPPSLDRRAPNGIWSLKRKDAVRCALQNSKVMRQIGAQVAGLPKSPSSDAGATPGSDKPAEAMPGHYERVVIARQNTDISLLDFEAAVRNLVSDVESTYWELYFFHRQLDAVVAGRDRALETWQKVRARQTEGNKEGAAAEEAQAREQYFLFRTTGEQALSSVYDAESRLRYLMGLAAADGRLIRPGDEPTTDKVKFDWMAVSAEALRRSVEIRRLRWEVKRRELELIAAKNLATSDEYKRRNVGLRNAELAATKERAKLQEAELDLSHQMADAIRNLEANHVLAETNFNRRLSAEREMDAVNAAYETGAVALDVLLKVQRARIQAESDYYRAAVNYVKSVAMVHYREGSLLEYEGVSLADESTHEE